MGSSDSDSPLKDRMQQCLRDMGLGLDTPLDDQKRLALYRLVRDLSPDRKSMQEMRSYLHAANRRRRLAEKELDRWRDAAERLLCDCPSKNETLRTLEKLLNQTRVDMSEFDEGE